jgi:purine-binding chemotaxis protein CheW
VYIVVVVADRQLALKAHEVFKVIEVGAIARLPRLPRGVVGITPYRGRIITVIDPAILLGQQTQVLDAGPNRRIVLLDSAGRNIGLLVERVEVISNMDAVEPKRNVAEDAFVTEIASHGSRTLGVIDGAKLVRRIAGLGDL